MPNLAELVKRLIDHKVQFVLVGGFAATIHGSACVTQDVDICIPFTEANCRRLLSALQGLHPLHRENKRPIATNPSRLAGLKNLYLLTDDGPLDVLGMVSELGMYTELLSHTVEISLFDRVCRVLDIDGLIRSKRTLARPKDKEAILQLRAIKERLKRP
ncbi:MAG: hypothetical protein HY543_10770 [Deltaproteobacteria bacterium]|nr:hypothetical protein [Deltaproteobacteria bacterium]